MRKKIFKITIIAESIFDKNTIRNLLGRDLKALRGKTIENSPIYISIEEAERIE